MQDDLVFVFFVYLSQISFMSTTDPRISSCYIYLFHISENKRSPEDDQLFPDDSGPRGLPPLLQRDQEGQQRRVPLRLLRLLRLQERDQARQQSVPTGEQHNSDLRDSH